MKYLHHIAGILCGFALMITLLITSVEAVCYWTPGYYEKEYIKYQVLDDVHMEMDDLLEVTEEMMAYLRGEREDLHIPTVVDGEPREFFNEREIAHMEDVRGLFLAALQIRRICLVLMVVCVALLLAARADVGRILPQMICIGTGIFFAILAVLTGVIASDFSKYFVIFHHIFFRNDLWILDPTTDLLINIVPEPFFMDTAARIGLTYGISVVLVFVVCLLLTRKAAKKTGEN
ncbi:MAG: TIGR01906 family membrane protein [Clostridiales bacterium]|nr:TIGR01906 family membrane protein [Clostridiales bacterium]